MKTHLILFAAAAVLAAHPVSAEDVLAKYKCNSCHDATVKKVGPAWKTIAAKITPNDVKTALQKGSKGKYGKTAMPPQPKALPEADAIAKAIMAMK